MVIYCRNRFQESEMCFAGSISGKYSSKRGSTIKQFLGRVTVGMIVAGRSLTSLEFQHKANFTKVFTSNSELWQPFFRTDTALLADHRNS